MSSKDYHNQRPRNDRHDGDRYRQREREHDRDRDYQRRPHDSYHRGPSPDRNRSYDDDSANRSLNTASAGVNIGTNPQAVQNTRSIRRLYAGNLPSHLPLNELALSDYFVQYMKHLGFTTPSPVLSVTLHHEKTYCFVEFRSVADTDAVLALMNGAEMGGRRIKLSRPKDYAPSPSDQRDFIVGYEPGSFKPPTDAVPADESAAAAVPVADLIPTVDQTVVDAVLPFLLPALGLEARSEFTYIKPSSCIMLVGMIDGNTLYDDENWLDTVDDIRDECSTIIRNKRLQGSVSRVYLPRPTAPIGTSAETDQQTGVYIRTGDKGPWFNTALVGRVYIRFSDEETALGVAKNLHNQLYNCERISAFAVDPSNFDILESQ